MDEGFDVTKRYLQLPYHPLTHTAARALTHTHIHSVSGLQDETSSNHSSDRCMKESDSYSPDTMTRTSQHLSSRVADGG